MMFALKLISKRLLGALAVAVGVGMLIWYIQDLRSDNSELTKDKQRLEFTLKEVVGVVEENVKELDYMKTDHALQMELVQEGLSTYNEHSLLTKEMEGRINYVKKEDDGLAAPILANTFRLLNAATTNSNEGKGK